MNDNYYKMAKDNLKISEEREKRAAELLIANKDLAFQNEEKEKRAAEPEFVKPMESGGILATGW